ncbi:MAG: hypothetical protein ACP5VQ_04385 [Phycisphaerae bacterium]
MRRIKQTNTFLIVPLILSVGVVSYAVLAGSLLVLALMVLSPPLHDLHQAEVMRNNLRATLELINEKIALQKHFLKLANSDPRLMQRLADRQLNVVNPNEEVLPLANDNRPRDVQSLIDEALKPVEPQSVPPLPWIVNIARFNVVRGPLIILVLGGLVVAFLLDIRRV